MSFSALLKLIDAYRFAGRLDELEVSSREILKENPDNLPVKSLIRYFSFRNFAKAGDLAGLYETARRLADKGIFEPGPWCFEWGPELDVIALACTAFAQGEGAFDFCRRRIEKLWDDVLEQVEREKVEEERGDDGCEEEDEDEWIPGALEERWDAVQLTEFPVYMLSWFKEKEAAAYLLKLHLDLVES